MYPMRLPHCLIRSNVSGVPFSELAAGDSQPKVFHLALNKGTSQCISFAALILLFFFHLFWFSVSVCDHIIGISRMRRIRTDTGCTDDVGGWKERSYVKSEDDIRYRPLQWELTPCNVCAVDCVCPMPYHPISIYFVLCVQLHSCLMGWFPLQRQPSKPTNPSKISIQQKTVNCLEFFPLIVSSTFLRQFLWGTLNLHVIDCQMVHEKQETYSIHSFILFMRAIRK